MLNSTTLDPYAAPFQDATEDDPTAEERYHAARAAVEAAFEEPQVLECPFCDGLWVDGVCDCPPCEPYVLEGPALLFGFLEITRTWKPA